MERDDNDGIERRKFPTIALGLTCLVLALALILIGAKYCTSPNAYTGEFISTN